MGRGRKQHARVKLSKERKRQEKLWKTVEQSGQLQPPTSQGADGFATWTVNKADEAQNVSQSLPQVPTSSKSTQVSSIPLKEQCLEPEEEAEQGRLRLQESTLYRLNSAVHAKGMDEKCRMNYLYRLRKILETTGMEATEVVKAFEEHDMEIPPSPPDSVSSVGADMGDDSDNDEESNADIDEVELDSDADNEEEESETSEKCVYKPRMPCIQCRRDVCANCFVKFTSGEKRYNKIPSTYHAISTLDWVSLEVALICVFDPVNPYLKWAGVREMMAMTKKAKESSIKGAANDTDSEGNLQGRFEGEKHNGIENGGSMLTNYDVTTRMVAEIVHSKNETLPDFYFCRGCAELATVLFTAWERLEMNKMPMATYFQSIMAGFMEATHAQRLIYQPPKDSTYSLKNKFDTECHPKGCLHRTSNRGVRIKLESDEDLINNAVGNLFSFLHESFCRVFNEILKELLCDFDGDSTNVFWGSP